MEDTKDTLDMLVSRVHLQDIIATITAAGTRNEAMVRADGERTLVFNVADDLPTSRKDVFEYAMELGSKGATDERELEQPAERTSPIVLSARNRDRGSKKVSNSKMKRLLLSELKFPSYREGLQAIARDAF